MASSSHPRSRSRRSRGSSRLSLSVTDSAEAAKNRRRAPEVPWLVAAVGGGVLSALVAWVACAAIAVVGWLGASAGSLRGALTAGSQLLFWAQGAGARVDGVRLTLPPLGLTAGLAALVAAFAGFATRQAARADGWATHPPGRVARLRLMRRIVAVITATYVGSMLTVATVFGQADQVGRVLLGAIVIAGLAATWSSARVAGVHFVDAWPRWARALPRAAAAGAMTLLAVGAGALAASAFTHRSQIAHLTKAVDLGPLGGLTMLALQLLFLPDLALWAGAYALGAGFTVGDGSLVSPVVTHVGMLPALPVTAALPHAGIHGASAWWWLLSGIAAGAVAAAVVLRGRPAARFDETAVVGGLAGALAGLTYTALAGVARGDLGTGRLVGLGPRMLELLVMSVTVLGLAGLATGLVAGLLRRPAPEVETAEPRDTGVDEPTRVVPVLPATPAEPEASDEPDDPIDEANEPTNRIR